MTMVHCDAHTRKGFEPMTLLYVTIPCGVGVWKVKGGGGEGEVEILMYTAISRKVVGKLTRQSRKVLWVVLCSLSSKKFERTFASAKGNSTATVSGRQLIISHITFLDCRVRRFFFFC